MAVFYVDVFWGELGWCAAFPAIFVMIISALNPPLFLVDLGSVEFIADLLVENPVS